jgi:hypothetical protein
MLSVLVVLILLAACIAAIYLLLKNMGESGIEAAAPGSCRSGRCGVQPRQNPDQEAAAEPERFVLPAELKRLDRRPGDQG